ncbi:hypothetical protein ACA910_020064 [Epithemia clementina (nom. ined.)]
MKPRKSSPTAYALATSPVKGGKSAGIASTPEQDPQQRQQRRHEYKQQQQQQQPPRAEENPTAVSRQGSSSGGGGGDFRSWKTLFLQQQGSNHNSSSNHNNNNNKGKSVTLPNKLLKERKVSFFHKKKNANLESTLSSRTPKTCSASSSSLGGLWSYPMDGVEVGYEEEEEGPERHNNHDNHNDHDKDHVVDRMEDQEDDDDDEVLGQSFLSHYEFNHETGSIVHRHGHGHTAAAAAQRRAATAAGSMDHFFSLPSSQQHHQQQPLLLWELEPYSNSSTNSHNNNNNNNNVSVEEEGDDEGQVEVNHLSPPFAARTTATATTITAPKTATTSFLHSRSGGQTINGGNKNPRRLRSGGGGGLFARKTTTLSLDLLASRSSSSTDKNSSFQSNQQRHRHHQNANKSWLSSQSQQQQQPPVTKPLNHNSSSSTSSFWQKRHSATLSSWKRNSHTDTSGHTPSTAEETIDFSDPGVCGGGEGDLRVTYIAHSEDSPSLNYHHYNNRSNKQHHHHHHQPAPLLAVDEEGEENDEEEESLLLHHHHHHQPPSKALLDNSTRRRRSSSPSPISSRHNHQYRPTTDPGMDPPVVLQSDVFVAAQKKRPAAAASLASRMSRTNSNTLGSSSGSFSHILSIQSSFHDHDPPLSEYSSSDDNNNSDEEEEEEGTSTIVTEDHHLNHLVLPPDEGTEVIFFHEDSSSSDPVVVDWENGSWQQQQQQQDSSTSSSAMGMMMRTGQVEETVLLSFRDMGFLGTPDRSQPSRSLSTIAATTTSHHHFNTANEDDDENNNNHNVTPASAADVVADLASIFGGEPSPPRRPVGSHAAATGKGHNKNQLQQRDGTGQGISVHRRASSGTQPTTARASWTTKRATTAKTTTRITMTPKPQPPPQQQQLQARSRGNKKINPISRFRRQRNQEQPHLQETEEEEEGGGDSGGRDPTNFSLSIDDETSNVEAALLVTPQKPNETLTPNDDPDDKQVRSSSLSDRLKRRFLRGTHHKAIMAEPPPPSSQHSSRRRRVKDVLSESSQPSTSGTFSYDEHDINFMGDDSRYLSATIETNSSFHHMHNVSSQQQHNTTNSQYYNKATSSSGSIVTGRWEEIATTAPHHAITSPVQLVDHHTRSQLSTAVSESKRITPRTTNTSRKTPLTSSTPFLQPSPPLLLLSPQTFSNDDDEEEEEEEATSETVPNNGLSLLQPAALKRTANVAALQPMMLADATTTASSSVDHDSNDLTWVSNEGDGVQPDLRPVREIAIPTKSETPARTPQSRGNGGPPPPPPPPQKQPPPPHHTAADAKATVAQIRNLIFETMTRASPANTPLQTHKHSREIGGGGGGGGGDGSSSSPSDRVSTLSCSPGSSLTPGKLEIQGMGIFPMVKRQASDGDEAPSASRTGHSHSRSQQDSRRPLASILRRNPPGPEVSMVSKPGSRGGTMPNQNDDLFEGLDASAIPAIEDCTTGGGEDEDESVGLNALAPPLERILTRSSARSRRLNHPPNNLTYPKDLGLDSTIAARQRHGSRRIRSNEGLHSENSFDEILFQGNIKGEHPSPIRKSADPPARRRSRSGGGGGGAREKFYPSEDGIIMDPILEESATTGVGVCTSAVNEHVDSSSSTSQAPPTLVGSTSSSDSTLTDPEHGCHCALLLPSFLGNVETIHDFHAKRAQQQQQEQQEHYKKKHLKTRQYEKKNLLLGAFEGAARKTTRTVQNLFRRSATKPQ